MALPYASRWLDVYPHYRRSPPLEGIWAANAASHGSPPPHWPTMPPPPPSCKMEPCWPQEATGAPHRRWWPPHWSCHERTPPHRSESVPPHWPDASVSLRYPPCCLAHPSCPPRSHATDPTTQVLPTSSRRPCLRGGQDHGDCALGASRAANQGD
jgi:hypothetical protein